MQAAARFHAATTNPGPSRHEGGGWACDEPVFSAKPGDVSAAFAFSAHRQPVSLMHAIGQAHRLGRWRIGSTLVFTPCVATGRDEVADAYLRSLDEAADLAIRPQLLVQLDALGYDAHGVCEVLVRSNESGVPVLLDHVPHHETEQAIECLAHIKDALHPRSLPGLSLRADGPGSFECARLALSWGLRIRIVHEWQPGFATSGASNVRFTRREAASLFLEMAHLLSTLTSTSSPAQVSITTHDPGLADQAIALLRSGGIRCAIELDEGQAKQGVLYVARQNIVPVRSHIRWSDHRPPAHSTSGLPRL